MTRFSDGRSPRSVRCAAAQWASSACGRVALHFWVAADTAIGWRTTSTNDASGNMACRNRVISRLGGDFSISTCRLSSQWRRQLSHSAWRF